MPTTVILGTGIIGLSTAYYLSHLADEGDQTTSTPQNPHGPFIAPAASPPAEKHEIRLVEPSPELFASASGKAAGFLAKDWFSPAVAPLGAFSFDLHRRLAEEHAGNRRWGWTESVSYSLDRDESDVDKDEIWQSDDCGSSSSSSDEEVYHDAKEEVAVSGSGAGAGAAGGTAESGHAVRSKPVSPTTTSSSQSSGGSDNGEAHTRMKSSDLGWLMDGSSRASVLDEPHPPNRSAAASGTKDSNSTDGSEDDDNDDSELPKWLRAKRSSLQAISDKTTTGQVDPYRLCQFLLSECQARGVVLHHPARATQLTNADPEDPASPTYIRLEHLDAAALVAETRGATPNSISPPNDVVGVGGKGRGEALGLGLVSSMQSVGAAGAHGNGKEREACPVRPSGHTTSPPYVSEGSSGSSGSSSKSSSSEGLVSTSDTSESGSTNGGDGFFASDAPLKANGVHGNDTGRGHGHRSNGHGHGHAHSEHTHPAPSPSHITHIAVQQMAGNGSARTPGTTVDIRCDSIVIAAGCWTPRVYRTLFPNAGRIPRVTALAGHSLVLKSPRWPPVKPEIVAGRSKVPAASGVSAASNGHVNGAQLKTSDATRTSPTAADVCHAVFTGDRAGYSPEIFSRAGGDVWLGGLNSSSIPLPAVATAAVPDPAAIATLLHTGRALCGQDVEVLRTGLCFRPVAPTGRPVVARMHEADLGDGAKVRGGVFVATGHGPWGISLSLGTGYVVGEMVLGREPSVDVKTLGRWEAQAP